VIVQTRHIRPNYHRFPGAQQVDLTFADRKTYKGRVEVPTRSHGIGIIQKVRRMKPACWSAKTLAVGQKVFAIGKPFGHERRCARASLSRPTGGGPGRKICKTKARKPLRPIAAIQSWEHSADRCEARRRSHRDIPYIAFEPGRAKLRHRALRDTDHRREGGVLLNDLITGACAPAQSVLRPLPSLLNSPDQWAWTIRFRSGSVMEGRQAAAAERAGLRGRQRGAPSLAMFHCLACDLSFISIDGHEGSTRRTFARIMTKHSRPARR